MSVTISITIECAGHPKYKGARKASTGCWGCSDIYELRHPSDNLLMERMIKKVEVKNNA